MHLMHGCCTTKALSVAFGPDSVSSTSTQVSLPLTTHAPSRCTSCGAARRGCTTWRPRRPASRWRRWWRRPSAGRWAAPCRCRWRRCSTAARPRWRASRTSSCRRKARPFEAVLATRSPPVVCGSHPFNADATNQVLDSDPLTVPFEMRHEDVLLPMASNLQLRQPLTV